jgi:hypothetical protein
MRDHTPYPVKRHWARAETAADVVEIVLTERPLKA